MQHTDYRDKKKSFYIESHYVRASNIYTKTKTKSVFSCFSLSVVFQCKK